MIYRNTVTGAIVDIPSEINGGPWERIDAPAVSASQNIKEKKTPAKRKPAVKKG